MSKRRGIERARIDDETDEQRELEVGAMLGLLSILPTPELTPEQERRIEAILNAPDEDEEEEHETD